MDPLYIILSSFLLGGAAFGAKSLLTHKSKEGSNWIYTAATRYKLSIEQMLDRTYRPDPKPFLDTIKKPEEQVALKILKVDHSYNKVHVINDRFSSQPKDEDFLKLRTTGTNVVRFLPIGKDKWFITRRQHYLRFINKAMPACQCPKKWVETPYGGKWEGDCVLCDHHQMLWAKTQKLSGRAGSYHALNECRNMATAFKPVHRFYYNVLEQLNVGDSSQGDIYSQPKIFSANRILHEQLCGMLTAEPGIRPEAPFYDLVNGRDIKIRKEISPHHEWPRFTCMECHTNKPAYKELNAYHPQWDLEKVAKSWEKTRAQVVEIMNLTGVYAAISRLPKG